MTRDKQAFIVVVLLLAVIFLAVAGRMLERIATGS
jgi:hypothetical protein